MIKLKIVTVLLFKKFFFIILNLLQAGTKSTKSWVHCVMLKKTFRETCGWAWKQHSKRSWFTQEKRWGRFNLLHDITSEKIQRIGIRPKPYWWTQSSGSFTVRNKKDYSGNHFYPWSWTQFDAFLGLSQFEMDCGGVESCSVNPNLTFFMEIIQTTSSTIKRICQFRV